MNLNINSFNILNFNCNNGDCRQSNLVFDNNNNIDIYCPFVATSNSKKPCSKINLNIYNSDIVNINGDKDGVYLAGAYNGPFSQIVFDNVNNVSPIQCLGMIYIHINSLKSCLFLRQGNK